MDSKNLSNIELANSIKYDRDSLEYNGWASPSNTV